MQAGRVESLKLLSHIKAGLDYCLIRIDFDELRIFGQYNDLVQYVGKYVKYSTAEDMYQGEIFTRVAEFCIEQTVQTVDRVENVKLLPQCMGERSICNFSSLALRAGDSEINCTALLCGYEKGASSKAKWVDLSLVDRNAKMFGLRMFTGELLNNVDPELALEGMKGKYVRFNVSSTKYGLQTDRLEVIDYPVVPPPEVAVAISQIEQHVGGDEQLCEYMRAYQYIETLKNIIYGEPGYHLVELASELYMIDTLGDIACEYDCKLLQRAAVTSRGYLLPSKNQFSKVMLNTNKVLRSALKGDMALIGLLDLPTDGGTPDKKVFYRIKKFCRQVINERRGLNEESVYVDFEYIHRSV